MSEPSPAVEYLAALNAALEVGLRSRRRILSEVNQHLHDAAMAQWTAMVKEAERRGEDGDSEELWIEAQRRAVAAFGSAQEVAASFESGLLGALDRRLAVTARRIDEWMARRPWGGGALRIALALAVALALAAVSAPFDPSASSASLVERLLGPGSLFLTYGTLWALYRGAQARALRDRPEPGFRARLSVGGPQLGRLLGVSVPEETQPGGGFMNFYGANLFLASAWHFSFALILAPGAYGGVVLDFLFWGFLTGGMLLSIWIEERAFRDHRGKTDADRQRAAWRAEHPWWAVLLLSLPAPLALLPLFVLSSAPLGARLVLGALFVAVAALLTAGIRLGHSQDERDAFERRMAQSR